MLLNLSAMIVNGKTIKRESATGGRNLLSQSHIVFAISPIARVASGIDPGYAANTANWDRIAADQPDKRSHVAHKSGERWLASTHIGTGDLGIATSADAKRVELVPN